MAAPTSEVEGAPAAERTGGEDARVSNDASDEPHALCCPITMTLLRDPVFLGEAGTTYERSALEAFWRTERSGRRRDPLTNRELHSAQVFVNWDVRRQVAAWLAEHPTRVPAGWASRDDIPPAQSVEEQRRAARRRALPLARLLAAASTRAFFAAMAVTCALCLGFNLPLAFLPDPAWEPARPHSEPPDWALDTAHASARTSHKPPRGSKLRVWELRGPTAPERALSVYSPRCRLGELDLTHLGGALFTLGFTLSWTVGALRAGAPFIFVLFSAPFWLVGARLMRISLTPLVEAVSLDFGPAGVVVRSELGLSMPGLGLRAELRARALRVPYADILHVRLAHSADETARTVLTLDVGAEAVEWGGGLSQRELQWLCKLSHSFLTDLGRGAAESEDGEEARAARSDARELAERLAGPSAGGGCALPPPVLISYAADAGFSASRGLHFHL